MKKVHVDARGKNCPEPVVMTKNAITPEVTEVITLVDNEISAENVLRFLTKNNFRVDRTTAEGTISLAGVRAEEEQAKVNTAASEKEGGGQVVLLTHATIGGDDKELGEVLMKAYLGALSHGVLPAAVILMNEGVKLALPRTSSAEHLQTLESGGVEILVCGTCVKHFGIETAVGRISNMFEISQYLAEAHHVVSF